MSFGSSSSSNINLTVTVNDAGVNSAVSNINSKINSIGTNAETVGNKVAGPNGIGAKLASIGPQIANTANSVALFAISITNIARSYRDLGYAHHAVETAQLKQDKAARTLTNAQDALQKLIDAGVTSGPEYEKAINNLKIAQDGLRVATQTTQQRQKEYNDVQTDFYLNIIPATITSIGLIMPVLEKLAGSKGFGAVKTAVTGLTTALSGSGGLSSALNFLAGPAGPFAALAFSIELAREGVTVVEKINALHPATEKKSLIQRPFINLPTNAELKAQQEELRKAAAGQPILDALFALGDKIKSVMDTYVIPAFKTGFGAVQNFLNTFVLNPVSFVMNFLAGIGNTLAKNVTLTATMIGNEFTKAVNGASVALTKLGTTIWNFITQGVGDITAWFIGLWNAIPTKPFVNLGANIWKLITQGFTGLSKWFINLWNTVPAKAFSNLGTNIFKLITSAFTDLEKWFVGLWSKIPSQPFINFGANIWKLITQGIGNVGKWITDNIVTPITNAINKLKSLLPKPGGLPVDSNTPNNQPRKPPRAFNQAFLQGDGEIPQARATTLQINNTAAIRAIDVVAKRIASLSTIQAVIKLANTAAIKITDVVAKRIDSLTTIKPLISLQNKVAIRNTDVVAKRIDDLTSIKPSISLSNTKALKVVDAVAKRIMGLEKLNPTVNVKVKFSGSGSISGAAHGSIKVAQHGMHEQLKENTLILAHKGEAVDINPHPNSNAAFGNSGTIVVNLTNVNSDRETTRVFRRKLGENQFRFGPR